MPGTALTWELLVRDQASPALARVAGEADRAASAMTRTQTTAEKATAAMAATGAKLTKSVTLPLAGLAAVSVDQAAKFQSGLNTVAVATDRTAKQTAQAQRGLMSIAKQTGTSLDQLTDSYYNASKAGQSVSKALATTKAAAQGAKAEGADLGTVTSALTSIMASYGKSLNDPVKAMNEIVRGAGLAKTTTQDFAASLSNVVPLASSLHVSFAQVAGAIDTMTEHGETAQRATDNLSNFITNLAGQNNVASAALQQLKVNTISLSKNLGKRGLTGSLDDVLAAVAKNSKGGLVVTSAFKQAATATASLKTEIAAMPPALQKQSASFDAGKTSYKDYLDYAKSLGGQNYQLARGFLTTESTARGWNKQLTSGNSTVRTTAATLQKALGGVTGMRVALMLSGQSAETFKRSTEAVGKAALNTGSDVLGWNKTQQTLAVRMDRAKESLQVLAVEAGTALIPTISKVVSVLTNAVQWFDNLSSGQKRLIGYAALSVAALGPVLSIGARLIQVYKLMAGGIDLIVGKSAAMVAAMRGEGVAANENVALQANAAARVAEAEAQKATAVAEAAVDIAASLEGTESVLAAEASAAATDAIEFAAAMRSKAEAAISAAAQIAAAESGLATDMDAAAAAQVAASSRATLGIQANAARQDAAVAASAKAGVGSRVMAGGMALGGGYLGAQLAGNLAGGHINQKNLSIGGGLGLYFANVGGGAAGGAAFGAAGGPAGALLGGALGAGVGAIKGLITVWKDVGNESKNANAEAEAGLRAQNKAAGQVKNSLSDVASAFNAAYKAQVAQQLVKSGSVAVAQKAGVSPSSLVSEVYKGNFQSMAKLDLQLQQAAAHGKITQVQMTQLEAVLGTMQKGAAGAEGQFEQFNAAMGKGVLPASQLGVSVSKLERDFKSTGNTLDTTSAAGKRNTAIIAENVQALNNGATAALRHGTAVKKVATDYAGQLGAMQMNLRQLGFNDAAVDKIIGTYARVPAKVATQLIKSGVLPSDIQAIIAKYAQIPASKTTHVGIDNQASPTIKVIQSQLAALKNKTVYVNTVSGQKYVAPGQSARSQMGYASGGGVQDGWFSVGERGYELGYKRGSKVEIFSNAASKAMTGLSKLPGYASGSLPGDASKIAATLSSAFGLTRNQIAGFLGNFKVESGFNRNAYNAAENAHGYAQWEGGRWTALQNLAAKMGVSATSSKAELAYLVKELRGSGVVSAVKSMSNPAKIAAYVDAHYERSSGDARQARENAAVSIASALKRVGIGPGSSGLSAAQLKSVGPTDRIHVPSALAALRVVSASSFAGRAASQVASGIAGAVLPAASDPQSLAGVLGSATSSASGLTAKADAAGKLYSEAAARAAGLTKQLTALRDAQRKGIDALRAKATAERNEASKASQAAAAMPGRTKAEKAAKAAVEAHAKALGDEATAASQTATAASRANGVQVAALQKLQQAAGAAADKLKSAYGTAADAAKTAQEAAQQAATALVSSLQSQADALSSAMSSFQSTVSGGLTSGTDLATVWGGLTDAVSQAKDQMDQAQDALNSANEAVAGAVPDLAALTAAQNAYTQATSGVTTAQQALAAAQSMVAAGQATPSQYAALTAAQQKLTDALTAQASAQSDLSSAQGSGSSQPTADQLKAVADATTTLATATDAYKTALAAATGSGLQDQFNQLLASQQQFATDLTALQKAGASQDFVSQVAAMGASAGDQLAQALLAAGPTGIQALQATMTSIQKVADSTSSQLSAGFFGAGESALQKLVDGMNKQFPALQKALQPILAQLQAMFTITPVVVTPGGSVSLSSSGVLTTSTTGSANTKSITVKAGNSPTVAAVAANYGTTVAAIEALNPSITSAGAKLKQGTQLTIPGYRNGVTNFGGGLAYVHAGEMLTYLPPRSNVYTAQQTKTFVDTASLERGIDRLTSEVVTLQRQNAAAPAATGAAVAAAGAGTAKQVGKANARQLGRQGRRSGRQF